ncbi:MAG: acetoin utilization protein AcuC [Kiloniellales bacterium]|nr:acetoin utilization protein AcuC [Kiloniellales bacterium]
MRDAPRFIGSEIYRRSRYGAGHPLAIPRVSTVIDLARALGWLPDGQYLDSPVATPDDLARFHDRDYIAALVEAEATQSVSPERRQRYNIGCNGNPVFPEIFRRPATACGGSLLGAALIRDGGTVYNPAGGTHHGRPDRASGFCYFNDPALAIRRLLDEGVGRVLYLDVDAHHGDGVQAAFAEEPRVLTVSIHESGRWPMTTLKGAKGDGHGAGTVHDRAGGAARNLPVPAGFHDDEMAFLLDEAVLPLAEAFAPEAVVLQGGADALDDDPQSKLALTNRALWRVVAAVRPLAPRLLVLGGGGYNPWSVARCWTGVWGLLNERTFPERLPPQAEAVLRALHWRHRKGRNPPEHWFTTLADPPPPRSNGGQPIRPELRRLAALVLRD